MCRVDKYFKKIHEVAEVFCACYPSNIIREHSEKMALWSECARMTYFYAQSDPLL